MDLLRKNEPDGTYPPSYYRATANPAPDRPAFDGDRKVHVAIVGAGFTGLSAALSLAGKGLDVMVLEANRVGWGASGRNGGQLGTGQRVDQITLESQLGVDHARRLFHLAEEAKALARSHIADHAIACDLRPGQIRAELKPAGVAAAKEEAAHLARHLNYDQISPLNRAELRAELDSPLYVGGVYDRGAGHLHPLNYALGLAAAAEARGAVIHEMTRVTRVTSTHPHKLTTPAGTVTADRVIYAGNGYLGGLEPHAGRRIMPINNYIVATEPLGADTARSLIRNHAAVADSKFVVNYFRLSPDHRLLFGGGESYRYRFPRDIARSVRPNMLSVFPQLRGRRIEYAWGGVLGITRSRLPYFRVRGETRLAAGGFSGHGVAMATLAGTAMGRFVLGDTAAFNAFAELRHARFPGGDALRHPLLVLAMSWYGLRDRLGL
ncbi:MAG: FAD-binding oxidoreductase [Pseudomonadota bacterium]